MSGFLKTDAILGGTAALTAPATPVYWRRIPFTWKIWGIYGSLYTKSTSGAVTVDIRYVLPGVTIPTVSTGGLSLFNVTPLTIDVNKVSSVGGTVPLVFASAATDGTLVGDSAFAVFVKTAGTGAAGLQLNIIYTEH